MPPPLYFLAAIPPPIFLATPPSFMPGPFLRGGGVGIDIAGIEPLSFRLLFRSFLIRSPNFILFLGSIITLVVESLGSKGPLPTFPLGNLGSIN